MSLPSRSHTVIQAVRTVARPEPERGKRTFGYSDWASRRRFKLVPEQGPTYNPQGPTYNPQGPTHNPQGF